MSIYDEVSVERERQDAIWGREDRGAFILSTVLAEECGEVARAIHDVRFANGPTADVRTEAIQAAAVAVQIVERIDQGRVIW